MEILDHIYYHEANHELLMAVEGLILSCGINYIAGTNLNSSFIWDSTDKGFHFWWIINKMLLGSDTEISPFKEIT